MTKKRSSKIKSKSSLTPQRSIKDWLAEKETHDVINEYAEVCARISNSLELFVRRSYPGYLTSPTHKEIFAALERFAEAVARKERPRLMIHLPPRFGKSFIASERFPAYLFGKNPKLRIIATSNTKDLAATFSRRVRSILMEPWFQDIFPGTSLNPKSTAVDHWETDRAGAYRCAGVGGTITGFGADVIIVDDYLKGWEQAFSKTIRDKVDNWYQSEVRSRLHPGGGILLISTRWHENELVYRILEREPDRWEVLSYPAIDEHGNPLHPERYSREELEEIKNSVGDYAWNALYMQNPVSNSDLPFKIDDIIYTDNVNYKDHVIQATMDLAYTTGASSDYTALTIGGRDAAGTRRIWHCEERKVAPADRDTWILSILNTWVPRGLKALHIEGNADAIQRTKELVKSNNLKIRVEPLTHSGRSKNERILETQGYLPNVEFGPGSSPLVDRLLTWAPASNTPDDLPDAFAYLLQALQSTPPKTSRVPDRPPQDPTARAIWLAMRGKHS